MSLTELAGNICSHSRRNEQGRQYNREREYGLAKKQRESLEEHNFDHDEAKPQPSEIGEKRPLSRCSQALPRKSPHWPNDEEARHERNLQQKHHESDLSNRLFIVTLELPGRKNSEKVSRSKTGPSY